MTIVCDIAAAARPGCRAKKGLPVLVRLRQRASEALIGAGKGSPSMDMKIEADNDDLSHLNSSAKLRRVHGSPPSKKASPIDSSPALQEFSSSSPQSPRSIATSATLAEPMYFDRSGGWLMPLGMMGTGDGAVRAPPTLDHISSGYSTTRLADPPATVGAAGPSAFHLKASSGLSQSGSWNGRMGIPPNSAGSPCNGQASNPFAMEIDRSPAQGADGGQYPSIDSWQNAYEGDQGDLDFSMFVNLMGAGELGLDGNWN
jgi:hypothetical protein